VILVGVETITARYIAMLKLTLAHLTTSLKDASLLSRIIPSLQHQNCQKSNVSAIPRFVSVFVIQHLWYELWSTSA